MVLCLIEFSNLRIINKVKECGIKLFFACRKPTHILHRKSPKIIYQTNYASLLKEHIILLFDILAQIIRFELILTWAQVKFLIPNCTTNI